MDGVVRLFTESSFDRLFVISGIVLLLLAAIGSVSGKFELGKGGRIFAGLCGAVFVIGGLLMHSFHSFRLVSADILTRPIAYQGGCPMDVPIQGRIDAQGSGKVLYAIEYSGSPANRAATITFDENSPFQVVDATWKITESVDNGWFRLRIYEPQKMQTENVSLSVTCRKEPSASTPVPVMPAPPLGLHAVEGRPLTRVAPQPGTVDTCIPGYVWREASSNDHVCVLPAVRAQAQEDNRLAGTRREPGAFGPDTCKQGFVWRDAFSGDHVCTSLAVREQAARDNTLAASRRASQ